MNQDSLKPPRKVKGIHAVDLFCGAGGLSCGLSGAGISVVAGVDLDDACRFPFEANHAPAKFVHKDVYRLDASELRSWWPSDGFRLLAACAPCQPFSTYSQPSRREGSPGDDSRWSLLARFGELASAVRPDFIVVENVPQTLGTSVFQELVRRLYEYDVWTSVVDTGEFGVPQTRRRLVMIASLHGRVSLPIQGPELQERSTVRRSIGGLPPLAAGEVCASDPIHRASRLSAENLARIRASKAGGTWRDWAEDLRSPCHQSLSGATYPSVYGRMEWDKPAPTITTQCFGFGNGRFGHPEQDRAISLREAALLQTFPPGYKFVAPGEPVRFNRVGRLIGNAVPVKLAEAIGAALVRHVATMSRTPCLSEAS